MTGLDDYAGLFPPAGLDLSSAVAAYHAYRRGPWAWALGRFVLPLARLDEFRTAATPFLSGVSVGAPWRLSALVEPGTPEQLKAFHEYHARGEDRTVVDSIEGKAASPEAIMPYARFRETGLEVFVEVPVTDDPSPLVRAIAEEGLSAKIRTGGVTAGAFPTAREVAGFLAACPTLPARFSATPR